MARKKGGHGGGGGHDAAGGMRWLLTYADLITLLLILFVVLYSMSKIDAAKFKDLAQMLRAAFGGVLKQGPTFLQGNGDRIIPDLVPRLSAAVAGPEGSGTRGEVFRNERGVVVRLMTDNVLFPRGATTLNDEMKSILDAMAPALKETGRPVMVEGHTDDLPIRGGAGKFASNWELSTSRATQVVRYLIEKCGVPAGMLSAAGYAEFHPVVPNTGERARARNRRIDIIVLEGSAPAPAADAPVRPVEPAIPAPAVPVPPPMPAVPAPPPPPPPVSGIRIPAGAA